MTVIKYSDLIYYCENPRELLSMSEKELEDIFSVSFARMKDFNQNNPHHCFDLLGHTVKTVESLDCSSLTAAEAAEIKIACLYHDIGKPEVAFEKDGRTVFYNHALSSVKIAKKELEQCLPKELMLDRILFYIGHHDDFISFKCGDEISASANPYITAISVESIWKKIKSVQRLSSERGEYCPSGEDYRRLMRLCKADAAAQKPIVYKDGVAVDSVENKLRRHNEVELRVQMLCDADKYSCDFHTHSTASDGTYSPTELVRMAAEKGIKAIALTDHNNINGIKEFNKEAERLGIDAVPGIEISAVWEDKDIHILGLFVAEGKQEKIESFLSDSSVAKQESNRKIIAGMKADGYDVDWEELVAFSDGAAINRSVIAMYLVNKKIMPDPDEAFATVLSKRKGYYVPPARPSASEVIRFIKSIGAVAVLAHPLHDLTPEELERIVPEAKAAGLDALEAIYSTFTDSQRQLIIDLAERNGLKISGGSDYHGKSKKDIELGVGRGNLHIPLGIYLQLLSVKSK